MKLEFYVKHEDIDFIERQIDINCLEVLNRGDWERPSVFYCIKGKPRDISWFIDANSIVFVEE